MTEQKKRTGRPMKPVEGEGQVAIGMRIPRSLRAKLERAAKENNRTLSQEAEHRLERGFRKNADDFYSPTVAALCRSVASMFEAAGQRAALEKLGPDATPDQWILDPDCYTAAFNGALEGITTIYLDGWDGGKSSE